MIEVTVIETGDSAEAEDPESAVFAAVTIGREARKDLGMYYSNPTIQFRVNGKLVRTATLRSLTR